jgi:hypothetical protein
MFELSMQMPQSMPFGVGQWRMVRAPSLVALTAFGKPLGKGAAGFLPEACGSAAKAYDRIFLSIA